MTPKLIRSSVVTDRASWVRRVIAQVRQLPIESLDLFESDDRNVAAAESFIRRSLEALFDLGRHVLANGFGEPASEYKAIADALARHGVLPADESRLLKRMAGYRNRMVHLYSEVQSRELFEICRDHITDIEALLDAILGWLRDHPELLDDRL